jgi:O-methyltransferase
MSLLHKLVRSVPRRISDELGAAKLGRDTRAVRKEGLTYLSVAKLRRIEDTIDRIVQDNVSGHILEFGVALGGSAIILAKHATVERQFHGFDVFAMIPPPTSDKDDAKSYERFDVIRSGKSTGIRGGDDYYGYRDNLYEDVKASFARHGRPVDGTAIQLHKGLFEETWPTQTIDRVAFAHVDCDWYDPVSYCLGILADRMSPGGVIILDDYHDYGGARTAVDEFLLARDDFTFEAGPNPILRKG